MTELSLKEYRGQTLKLLRLSLGAHMRQLLGLLALMKLKVTALRAPAVEALVHVLQKVTEAGLFCSRSTKVQGL